MRVSNVCALSPCQSQDWLHLPLRTLLVGGLVFGLCLMVAGCDSGGTSGGEDPEPTAPAAPTGLVATSGNAQVSLDWETVEEAESYAIYRSTDSMDGATGDPLEEGLSEVGYTDSSVENGTTYYYRVTAVGTDDNESEASEEVEVTPFDEPPTRPE